MNKSSWEDTALWHELLRRGDSAKITRTYVLDWLTEVQLILSKANTAPLDFTLHDDEHSFRVAQRIEQLVPTETLPRLSDYEIGLALQSAYLHDIGMNPRREVVKQIRNYLLTGNLDGLHENEAEKLRRWLDKAYPGVQPAVSASTLKEQLELSEQITAYFCRERHNDWSEEYILERSQLSHTAPPYPTWTIDLINLCKSHHYGAAELLRDDFDLRMVGSSGRAVNLRYLAAYLRLADVLEFDPERTPSVIFAHRSINPGSQIFWYKDQEISLSVRKDQPEILISARTSSARVNKAVIETAEMVDRELQLCAALNDRNTFIRGVTFEKVDHYCWIWPRLAAKDVQPRANAFVYIDGAFRPNPHRVISLLAGSRIYSSPVVALRELLQNAFDAVKEQIVRDTVARDAPSTEIQNAIAATHKVSLSMERENDRTWLVCSDTGVGMTKRVIESYLLVSASQPRPELLELKRYASEKGIDFERSGEFGIGVLSYFMLADKLILESKCSFRSAQDDENQAWRFEIESLEDFGELRPFTRHQPGTTVRLRLKVDETDPFLKLADNYLKSLLIKTPCNVEISLTTRWAVQPGWAKSAATLLAEIPPIFSKRTSSFSNDNLKSIAKLREESDLDRLVEWSEADARSKLALYGPRSGDLPRQLGTYRIHLPYFNLSRGPSLVYISESDNKVSNFAGRSLGGFVNQMSIRSWQGFHVSGLNSQSALSRLESFPLLNKLPKRPRGFILEVDNLKEGHISVDRNTLTLANENEITNFLTERCNELFNDFIKEHSSCYSVLSETWSSRSPTCSTHWMFPKDNKQKQSPSSAELEFRPIEFPAASVLNELDDHNRPILSASRSRLGIKDELRPIRLSGSTDDLFPLVGLQPSSFMLLDDLFCTPVLIYKQPMLLLNDQRVMLDFPDNWFDVIAVETNHFTIFNKHHRVVQKVTHAAWMLAQNLSTTKSNLDKLLDDENIGAAWILSNIGGGAEFWNALRDNFPEEFEKLLERYGLMEGGFLVVSHPHPWGLLSIERTGATFRADVVSSLWKGTRLPKPGANWFMKVERPIWG